MQITLTPDVEDALNAQALLQGRNPEEIVLDTLRKTFVASDAISQVVPTQKTLLDFLDGFIGVLRSNKPTEKHKSLSQNTGKAFTRILTEKRNQGRL